MPSKRLLSLLVVPCLSVQVVGEGLVMNFVEGGVHCDDLKKKNLSPNQIFSALQLRTV